MAAETAPEQTDSRRPTALDLAAALLLLTTVVLHVIAMVPTYFVGSGSLMSQADQAALYSVLAASWALALGIGLTGPHCTPLAAAVATGVALTEFGLRIADLGTVERYGASMVGAGFWLMEAAWVVGAVAAGIAVMAARARHAEPRRPGEREPSEWEIDWSAPADESLTANPYGRALADDETAEEAPTMSMAAPGAHDPTAAVPAAHGGDTSVLNVIPDAEDDRHERMAWTLLVVVLAIVTAGAFLPAWDHAVAVSTTTGQTASKSLGNVFSGPWEQVVGTVLSAVALLAIPIFAVRLRNKTVGAGLVIGALLVLAAQIVSAVVQVDQAVSPGDFGITAQQARELGLQLSLKLTGWFTLDALAAYALFAAVMVWATLRVVHDNSAAAPPITPTPRSDWMRSAP